MMALANGESHAEPGVFGGIERLEDVLQLFRGDANATVANGHADTGDAGAGGYDEEAPLLRRIGMHGIRCR